MRAAFHSAVSWLSSVMILKSSRNGEGVDEGETPGEGWNAAIGPGAPPHNSAWKIRQQGQVFPRSTSEGGHVLPCSRFERDSSGAGGPALLRLLLYAREKPKQKP